MLKEILEKIRHLEKQIGYDCIVTVGVNSEGLDLRASAKCPRSHEYQRFCLIISDEQLAHEEKSEQGLEMFSLLAKRRFRGYFGQ